MLQFRTIKNLQILKGEAIDIDHRLTKQQYTTLFHLNGTMGGRKTSCMACQHKTVFRSGCGSVGRAAASDTRGLRFANTVNGKNYSEHLFAPIQVIATNKEVRLSVVAQMKFNQKSIACP